MNNTSKQILIIAFIVLLITSCKKNNDDNTVNSNSFFKFGTVGNEWVYAEEWWQPGMHAYDTITNKIIADYNHVYEYTEEYKGTPPPAHWYWMIDTAFAEAVDQGATNPMVLLKPNAHLHDRYYYDTMINGTIYFEVVDTAANVTVPAGNFNTYKVINVSQDTIDTIAYYISKDYGIILNTYTSNHEVKELLSKNF